MDPSGTLRVGGPSSMPGGSGLLLPFSIFLVLIIVYPSLLLVSFLAFFLGYFGIQYFDKYVDKIDAFLESKGLKVTRPEKRVIAKEEVILTSDPLHVQETFSPMKAKPPSPKIVATATSASTPKFTPSSYQTPSLEDLSLKIDPRLDASLSKFLRTVFDYYISTDWAPFLTRKQLKLAFKELLSSLGERIKKKLETEEDFLVNLSKRKLVPLLTYYVMQVHNHSGGLDSAELILPEEKKRVEKLRVRSLCRVIIGNCIENVEEKKCKLWVELCIAVLADGVLWNVFELGRDKLPELIAVEVKERIEGFEERVETKAQIVKEDHQNSSVSGRDEVDNDKVVDLKTSSIPFLLDNFLDRKDSLEQADPIISRWRPTLKEIIEETELLYPLIQYLKHVGGQKALAHLQAVLDDTPDAKDHCKRVLEVEYLPGFCRSTFFHDAMGLSRVEEGKEAGIGEGSPSLQRRISKSHSRSASYGSKSSQGLSDLFRVNEGVIDGFPVYTAAGSEGYSSLSLGSASILTSSSGSQDPSYSDVSEPDYGIFGKKKAGMEDIVAKFVKSTLHHVKKASGTVSPDSSEGSPNRTKLLKPPRMGIDSKNYSEYSDPEVTKRVVIQEEECNVLKNVEEIVTSAASASSNPLFFPLVQSWLPFLDPYIQSKFDSFIDEKIRSLLNIDLFISLTDFITEAFIVSGTDETISSANIPEGKFEKLSPALESLLYLLHSSFRVKESLEKFLLSLDQCRDYFLLFFIDILDLLVAELFDGEGVNSK